MVTLNDLLGAELTVDDLERLPHNGLRYELHGGNLVVTTPAVMWHSRTGFRLANYFLGQGRAAYQEVGLKLGTRSSRTLDVAVFVNDEVDEGRAYFAPDEIAIAVEIVSPSSEDDDREDKPRRYAEAGIPEYWRVERADDRKDAVIFTHKLACTESGKAAYVETGVTLLSELEATA